MNDTATIFDSRLIGCKIITDAGSAGILKEFIPGITVSLSASGKDTFNTPDGLNRLRIQRHDGEVFEALPSQCKLANYYDELKHIAI